MSIHKLTAGSGYDYLTRQVAAMDATDKGHVGLASYYTEKGETPGEWVGSGMAGIEGLDAGDVVTADHMQNLFGAGHHPLATDRTRALDLQVGRHGEHSPTEADYKAAARLGTPYKVYANDISAFRIEVAKRIAAVNEAVGLPGDWPIPAPERAKIRTEVAQDFFRAEHGRDAADARELATTIAKHSRPRTNAVAGYDLTFSPVKSVSTLWAVADQKTAAVIERAHQAALKDALTFIEDKALYTRMGTNGVRQVDVRGLIGTAFTHRDSRAGDPDLHTHVAIANKVQVSTPDGKGKWLAIDGRVLFKATVAASETYNTMLERHLVDALGIRFEERPNEDARKRPVREIVGVDPALNTRFSKRRASVEDRRSVLASEFQATHGRPPTPVETIRLAQQATLETREAKHEPRSLSEQRETWHTEAVEVLGTPRRLQQMIHGALNPAGAARALADSKWFAETTDRIVSTMEGGRATWQYWHVYAEAQRQARGANVPTNQVGHVVGLLVDEVLDGRSISLARPEHEDVNVPLAGAMIGVGEPVEPRELRRADGSSVYAVAGADLFTSRRVVDAEAHLVAAGGRRDGYAVDSSCVDLALLESTANGVTLNAGQATLVREMATSGARLQLAIAPAGSGKTTAMRALAGAWTEGGGTVIGLAPSAAAADALRSQIDTQTDTLAKLVYTLTNPFGQESPPAWLNSIGPSTLVVIDEAGMADTLSLDVAVQYILGQGGSVRLVGDDQQLAAIGAGGALRDIRAAHGALQLTELIRFRDPAEGAASLALREGRSEALGFYLDRDRVHVGDLATMTDEVFDAWRADRATELDSIMLAPTRDLVSELNQRARAHRLDGSSPADVGPSRRLADGNDASVGDLIITRVNKRKLRVSANDWVKNGDRWTVLEVHPQGDLTVQHSQHGRKIRLPSDYVDDATELGYACTVHTAQGVTADTMHGLATGAESRQQLYTMMTRGAIGNHVYLEVVGDGDPHSVIHPTLVRPLTPTDILESMLAHDDAQHSATSLLREHADPSTRLGHAAQRYLDSLYVAAEKVVSADLGIDISETLDQTVDSLLPGLSDEAAWPTLRAHLVLLGANGEDPVAALHSAAADRELDSAADRAAVLDWRLDASGLRNAGAGPLPWMPGVPARLASDPHWGAYLTQRAHLVDSLAEQVHERASEHAAAGTLPSWAQNGIRPDAATLADVEVWRAAMQVDVEDRRPSGAPQLQKASATWQRRLNRRAMGEHTPALKEWRHLLHSLAPQVRHDDFTPLLAERLAAMSRAGVQAHQLLRTVTDPSSGASALPDEHAAAALWWRMARHLTPAVAAQVGDGTHGENVTTTWSSQLGDLVGADRARRIQASSWWPALVANVDHGLQRGWRLEDLLSASADGPASHIGDSRHVDEDVDECQALVWRTSIALVPIPSEDGADHDDYDEPPLDMWEGVEPPPEAHTYSVSDDAQRPDLAEPDEVADDVAWSATPAHEGSEPHSGPDVEPFERELLVDDERTVEGDLTLASLIRDTGPRRLEPTEADVRRMLQRAEEWDHSPVSRERMLEVNAMTLDYFEAQLTSTTGAGQNPSQNWGRAYLAERFGVGLAGHETVRPGHAPAGWTNLVDHLRRHGVSDEEMLATGVATQARTGRLIDRFRDRVVLPITRPSSSTAPMPASGLPSQRAIEVLGFVGRRRPDLSDDDKAGPKYLNTADTPLFHKGAQLYGVHLPLEQLAQEGATPVLVEGPMDAVAVTLASAGRFLGVAPLGTSLTDEQAAQLADMASRTGRHPIVATDADLAGQVAAERDFWLLTPHGMDPGYARFPEGMDPADLLLQRGPAALTAVLASAETHGQHEGQHGQALGDQLLSERLENLPDDQARAAALKVLAARPGHAWDSQVDQVASRLQVPVAQLRRELRDAVRSWDSDPLRAAQGELGNSSDVRSRLAAATAKAPVERWAQLARELDPRLLEQADWPATATLIQQAHEQGHDVATATRALVAETPLGDSPARDLRYRIVSRMDVNLDELPRPTTAPGDSAPPSASTGSQRDRQDPRPKAPRGDRRPRR